MMRLKTIAKTAIFISFGLFLASRLLNGTLSYYIHPRFNGLTALTAVGLILIGLIYAQQHWQTILTGEHEHEHNHEHDHDHDHDLSWLGLALLTVPLLLGLTVQPQPLGAAALQNREVNVNSLASVQAPEGSQLAVIQTAGERNILDWLYLFQRTEDPATFNGDNVHVIGFVYRDDRFADDEFMVSRFTVSCCVADAMPIGLIVRWPETVELPADGWVEVEGALQAGEFDGVEMPVLVAEKVAPTEIPAQPYLYQ